MPTLPRNRKLALRPRAMKVLRRGKLPWARTAKPQKKPVCRVADRSSHWLPRGTMARRDAHYNTWSKLHVKLHPGVPVLPLQVSTMANVVSHMRELGYRSASSYLSSMVRVHHRLDMPWTPSLAAAFKESMRMATRKLGPPRRAKPFSFARLSSAYIGGRWRQVKSFMIEPILTIAAGALFMLRAAELSMIRCNDISFCGPSRWAAMRLSSSKVDPAGRGCKIRWFCTCHCDLEFATEFATAWLCCPFHVIACIVILCHNISVDEFARSTSRTCPGDEKPFFVTSLGTAVSRVMIQNFLRALDAIVQLGDPLVQLGEHENEVFSGHSLRRSGMQHFVLLNVCSDTLRRLARWKSRLLEEYVGLAGTAALGRWTFQTTTNRMPDSQVQISTLLSEAMKILGELRAESRAVREVRQSLDVPQSIEHHTTGAQPQFVVYDDPTNALPPRAHRILALQGHCSQWRTCCGWRFSSSGMVSLLTKADPTAGKWDWCKKCGFKDRRHPLARG